jgi:hypothetical protein
MSKVQTFSLALGQMTFVSLMIVSGALASGDKGVASGNSVFAPARVPASPVNPALRQVKSNVTPTRSTGPFSAITVAGAQITYPEGIPSATGIPRSFQGAFSPSRR